jgi:hypothetical protein
MWISEGAALTRVRVVVSAGRRTLVANLAEATYRSELTTRAVCIYDGVKYIAEETVLGAWNRYAAICACAKLADRLTNAREFVDKIVIGPPSKWAFVISQQPMTEAGIARYCRKTARRVSKAKRKRRRDKPKVTRAGLDRQLVKRININVEGFLEAANKQARFDEYLKNKQQD